MRRSLLQNYPRKMYKLEVCYQPGFHNRYNVLDILNDGLMILLEYVGYGRLCWTCEDGDGEYIVGMGEYG